MSNYIMDLRKVVGHAPLLQAGASIIVENENGQVLLGRRTDNHFRVSYASLLSGCTNCDFGFLCLTKPSLLAIHGSIAPCPGFHAGAFLCFVAQFYSL